jgi:hypothetical protein
LTQNELAGRGHGRHEKGGPAHGADDEGAAELNRRADRKECIPPGCLELEHELLVHGDLQEEELVGEAHALLLAACTLLAAKGACLDEQAGAGRGEARGGLDRR